MSEDPKPNMMHGIAVYADPGLEMQKREYLKRRLGKVLPKDWPDERAEAVRLFGPDTVRAVARSYYQASDYK